MSTPQILDNNEGFVLRDQVQGTLTLTLNRPDQFNALSEEMIAALKREFDQIATDDTVRCVVLAAKGKAFCAGHDLKQMRANYSETYYQDLLVDCCQMMQTIADLPVPVIARVQGLATAGGCQLVASCDLAVASEKAVFAVSGINYGLFCSTPAVPLSRNISRKRAFEMLVTGEFIDSAKAMAWGLINDACPESELDKRISVFTDSICAKSRVPVRIGKEMFYHQLPMDITQAYEYASGKMVSNSMTRDAKEGMDAFMERRTPQWNDC